MLSFKTLPRFLILLLFGLVVACGGGAGNGAPTNDAPMASNISITNDNGGNAEVNDRLIGTYTYSDTDNDAEGATTYRWL